MENPTTLLDIYEAAGGIKTEDGLQVSITPPLHPFKIELLVVPTAIDMGPEGEFVTLDVLLEDELRQDGLGMRRVQHEASVQLPVRQVKIIKEV